MKVTMAILMLVLAGCDARFHNYTQAGFQVEKLHKGSRTYQARLPDCAPYELSPQMPEMEKCFVDSARMKSMVHPERMVTPQNPLTTNTAAGLRKQN